VILAAGVVTANVAIHGILLGLVYGLLAVGLILIYRASGIINFAHGEIGALGAAVLAKLVVDDGWSWYLAAPAVLGLGAAVGMVIEVVAGRRLTDRPKVALLVATIGLSQLLLVGQLLMPRTHRIAPFPTPIHRHLDLGSVRLAGPDFVAIAAVPAIVVGLVIWLSRTPSGRALAALGDNHEAAQLAGVRTHRLAMLAWVVAGVLATSTAIIANPLQGVIVGRPSEALGAGLMVRALAVALVGRLRSLPVAMAAGLGLGLVQAIADARSSDPSGADVVVLAVVLGALFVMHRSRDGREARPGEGELVRVSPVRRDGGWQRWAPGLAVAAIAVALPVVAGRASQLFFLTRVALFAVVGLSLVILTGWAGQVSLGQFAIVGIGTFGAGLLERAGIPFWAAVGLVTAGGAAIAATIGLPALRTKGLELAIATLALAVACRSWLFTRRSLAPGGTVVVQRGRLGPFDVRGPTAYYEVCALVAVGAAVVVGAIRRRRLGGTFLAVRSNEARAAAIGISAVRAKLTAFAIAGAFAAGAGALLGGLRVRSGAADFGPEESLRILAVAVIGGAGSVPGVIAGAVVVLGIPALFGDTTIAGLLPSGIGLLVLVMIAPGGLTEIAARARTWIGPRIPGSVPGWFGFTAPRPAPRGGRVLFPAGRVGRRSGRLGQPGAGPVGVSLRDVSVSFGGRVAIDNVSLDIGPGEVVGVIGGNGAGKTSLLDVIAGASNGPRWAVHSRRGTVTLGGEDVTVWPAAARAQAGVGRTLQDARLFEDLTVGEVLDLAAIGDPRERERDATAVAELLGLADVVGRPCQELSTGVRRLAELGCTIVRRPRLLLLDEPTAGLAQREAEAFVPLLGAVRDHLACTVIVVEHDVPLVRALVERLICLEAGTVLADGRPEEVLGDSRVVASFLGTDPSAIGRSGSR